MEDFLTAEELAIKLKVPLSWIYERANDPGPERLPHYRIGEYLRFSVFEVTDYLRFRAAASDETLAISGNPRA